MRTGKKQLRIESNSDPKTSNQIEHFENLRVEMKTLTTIFFYVDERNPNDHF